LEFIKKNKELQILDYNLGINCIYDGKTLKGSGSRKYHNEIIQEVNSVYKNNDVFTDKHKENCYALADVVDTWGSSNRKTSKVKVDDLYKWLGNPVKYNKNLRNLALYWYGEKGLVTETIELYKVLPNLNSIIRCTDINNKRYEKFKTLVDNIDYDLSKKTLIRDILFYTALEGTCIGHITNKKYIQLLDLDFYYPARMINGRWEVDVDLSSFVSESEGSYYSSDTVEYIENQPLEVRNAWRKYKEKSGSENKIYTLNQSNTFVLKIRSKQNERWGRPVSMGAFTALLHKELLQEAEKAVIDRIINTFLIVRYGEMGKDGYHPDKSEAKIVHESIKTILTKKTIDGIRVIGVPFWTDITNLKVDMDIFDPKKYEEIDNDIFIGLGISSILTTGKSNYASSKLNLERKMIIVDLIKYLVVLSY